MKHLLFLFIFITTIDSHASIPSTSEVRILYQKAAVNEEDCTKLIELLSSPNQNFSPFYVGYKGCATMIEAKYKLNPWSKYSYFNKGRKLLEEAITKDKENIELRFLRFTIQTKAPSFLGYSKNIEDDKAAILRDLNKVTDRSLKLLIISFLSKSTYLSNTEKSNL